MGRASILALLFIVAGGAAAGAQDIGTMNPQPLPPVDPTDRKVSASEIFGRKLTPFEGPAQAIGFYTSGCLVGGVGLPINGKTWQVMRLSRNRNWGHPNIIKFLERFSEKAQAIGWNGLLVGDMAQPRGGPMRNGHLSHQVGLDADVWFSPMPDREFTRQEREETMATNIVADDWKNVNPKIWSPIHIALLKAAAMDPEIERVLVNPAIKKALCRDVTGDRSWLHKMRPVPGHNYHFHVRISCPSDSTTCKPQPATPNDEGCGKDLDAWFKKIRVPAPPEPKPDTQPPRRRMIPLASLPPACRKLALTP